MAARGKPGRSLNDLELRHLRLLLEWRDRARARAKLVEETLGDFLLDLRDSGASTRGIENEIGISYRTIQTWMEKAEQRRAEASQD